VNVKIGHLPKAFGDRALLRVAFANLLHVKASRAAIRRDRGCTDGLNRRERDSSCATTASSTWKCRQLFGVFTHA